MAEDHEGNRQPIKVLILSDDLPGHVNQSRGLTRWLSTRVEIETTEYVVKLKSRATSRVFVRFQLNSNSPRRVFERYHTAGPMDDLERPDVIVSAGGNTSFANVLLSRHFGVPNVFIGSRRHIPPEAFSAHITLEPTGAESNIVVHVAPSIVDPAALPAKAEEFRATRPIEPAEYWLLAAGGNGAGISYDDDDWRRLGEWMNRAAREHGIRWLLSTSRRTGAAAEAVLKEAIDQDVVGYAVWWSEKPERVLLGMFGCATRLFVTTDSMSMISECIATERPVTLLRCGRGKHERRYQAALDRYVGSTLCTVTNLSDTPKTTNRPKASIAAMHEAQLEALIERIHG